jgi:hypothetical protein
MGKTPAEQALSAVRPMPCIETLANAAEANSAEYASRFRPTGLLAPRIGRCAAGARGSD